MYKNIWLFIVNFIFFTSFSADVRYDYVITVAGSSDRYHAEKAVF